MTITERLLTGSPIRALTVGFWPGPIFNGTFLAVRPAVHFAEFYTLRFGRVRHLAVSTLNSRSRATGIGERIVCYCPIDLAATKLPLTLVLQDPVLPEDSLQLIMW